MTLEKKYGIAGTFIINTLIVLILLFTYISLSKPESTEGGILINFGDAESAEGLNEPAMNNQPYSESQASRSYSEETDDGLLTQDNEEAPAVKPKVTAKQTVTKQSNETVQPKTKPEPEKPQVNTRALYKRPGQSTTESGSSEGIYKGSGNMGDPTGTTESDNYTKGLGGSGGIGFSLEGRIPVGNLIEPEYKIQQEGIVVVKITVDRSGKVISADPGKKGTTLGNTQLWEAAKKAALESKFSESKNAQERQEGYITYHFKLQ